MPRRSPTSPRRRLLRCAQLGVVLLLGAWALFHVVAALVLGALLGLLWVAVLPVRAELRSACARLVPRRGRVRMSDAEVEATFRHIVREEFGSSR